MAADGPIDLRAASSRVRLLRLLNGPISEPAGSRAYEKRLLHRRIILHYEIGGENRRAVADALGLSLRQFHREHRAATEWVVSCLNVDTAVVPYQPENFFDIERITLEHVAPSLAFAEAKRRFERLLSSQVDPALRLRAHLSFYEFLSASDDRDAVRSQRSALRSAIASISDDTSRSSADARRQLVDAQIAWRDGMYGEALDAAIAAAALVVQYADAGIHGHAVTLCIALQLQAQLRWETGAADEALGTLDQAQNIIRRHGLGTLPCAVTNSVGRSDLSMRNAARVPDAIKAAADAFDQAALYGDAEDASTALLISAMAHCGQRKYDTALAHTRYALEFVTDLAPVGRTRMLTHAAEVLIICRQFAQASAVLAQTASLVPIGSIADAQRQLRIALLTEVYDEPEKALPIVNAAIETLETKGADRFIGAGLKIRARIRSKLGDQTGGTDDLEAAVGHLRGESYAWTYAEALGQLGHATKNRTLVREAAALNRAMGAL